MNKRIEEKICQIQNGISSIYSKEDVIQMLQSLIAEYEDSRIDEIIQRVSDGMQAAIVNSIDRYDITEPKRYIQLYDIVYAIDHRNTIYMDAYSIDFDSSVLASDLKTNLTHEIIKLITNEEGN